MTKVRLSSSSRAARPMRADRLGLVHLAVAEVRPYVLVGGVVDAPVLQVAVEPRLIDRVDAAEAHRDRRELPEVTHEAGVRVRRKAATQPGVRELLAEAVELGLGEAALHEGAGVHARRRVALEEHLVAAAGVTLAPEEVVEAHLVEARRAGIRRDVPTGTDARPLRAVHHHGGVPPDVGPDAPLDVLVAGEPRLPLGRDRVDVVGRRQGWDADLALARTLEQPQHHVAGALPSALVDDAVERLDPLQGLLGIDVRQLARQAVADDRALAFGGHRRSFVGWVGVVPTRWSLLSCLSCLVRAGPSCRRAPVYAHSGTTQ